MSKRSDIQREYPAAPLVGVGALVIDHDRILLVRRGRPPSQGEWSIPGGLVRVGETLKEAVAREALEETGLHVEPQDLIELLERIFPDDEGQIRYHYILADYWCRVVGGELVAGSDATEVAWVEYEDLGHYSLSPVTMSVIMKAFESK